MKIIFLTSILFVLTWTMKSNAKDLKRGHLVFVENKNPDKYNMAMIKFQ